MNVRLVPRGEGEDGGELIGPRGKTYYCAKWSQFQTALPTGISTCINQRCSHTSLEKLLCAVGGRCVTQKVKLVKVHKVSVCGVFNHKWSISHSPSHQGSGTIVEEKEDRL